MEANLEQELHELLLDAFFNASSTARSANDFYAMQAMYRLMHGMAEGINPSPALLAEVRRTVAEMPPQLRGAVGALRHIIVLLEEQGQEC